MRLAMIAGLSLLSTLVGTGCRPAPDPFHPRGALAQYVRHIEANDPKAAYGMLSERLRKRLAYRAFLRKWRRSYAELRLQATEIKRHLGDRKRYEVRARMRLGKRRVVFFSHEGKRWRIVSGVGGGVDAATPREAVKALVRALEARSFSAFLKLLSSKRRKAFLREMNLRLEKLKASMDRDFEVTGHRARLQYDPGYWIMLIKENGTWRVLEFN